MINTSGERRRRCVKRVQYRTFHKIPSDITYIHGSKSITSDARKKV